MPIGRAKAWGDVGKDAFERFAERVGADPVAVVRAAEETFDAVRDAWPGVRDSLPTAMAETMERFWTEECAFTRRRLFALQDVVRTPRHPEGTHTAERSADGVVIRRRADGKIDNPIDAAIVRSDGREVHMRNGRRPKAAAPVEDTKPEPP